MKKKPLASLETSPLL